MSLYNNMNPTEADIKDILRPKVDPGNKGRFGVDDFLSMLTTTIFPHDCPQTLIDALEEIDHEGIGKVKVSDAEQAFRSMGEPFTKDEFNQFVAIGDPNNTGYIDIKEFTMKVMNI